MQYIFFNFSVRVDQFYLTLCITMLRINDNWQNKTVLLKNSNKR